MRNTPAPPAVNLAIYGEMAYLRAAITGVNF